MVHFHLFSFQYSSCLPVLSSNIKFQYSLNCFSNSSFNFLISWLKRVLLYQFDATYFTHVMYTKCQIPNFYLVCLSASPFEIFIVPLPFVSEFPYRLLSVSIPVILYSSIPAFIILVLVPSFAFFLSLSWFSVSMRCVCLFLAVSPFAWGSARQHHLCDETLNPSIGCPPPPFFCC